MQLLRGVTASPTLSDPIKKQLLGEAKFLRAFSYFYLVNVFGDVPLVISTPFTQNSVLERSPVTTIYGQIISDSIGGKRISG